MNNTTRAAVLLTFLLTPTLFAQQLGGTVRTGRTTADTFGTQGLVTYSVEALAFSPNDSSITYTYQAAPDVGIYWAGGGTGCFVAPVHLPEGAKVHSVILDFCDTNASDNVSGAFYRQPLPSGDVVLYDVTSSGTPGCSTRLTSNISSFNEVIDNYNNAYFVRACLGAPNATNVFKAVSVRYKLQVSAAPATATFSDVPTSHPFFQYIEALGASGITAGCTAPPNPQYCPDAPLTRGQMAVFLSRALGLHWPN